MDKNECTAVIGLEEWVKMLQFLSVLCAIGFVLLVVYNVGYIQAQVDFGLTVIVGVFGLAVYNCLYVLLASLILLALSLILKLVIAKNVEIESGLADVELLLGSLKEFEDVLESQGITSIELQSEEEEILVKVSDGVDTEETVAILDEET